ncbi:MAG TPA: 1-phosphofructokinase family hexose kinase [Anaeromyxobacter sp.]|nr:1-phosphofructokinase family hexose kinase [Anaeromyxobacter sp.]
MIYTVTLNPALDREYEVPALVLGEVLRASTVREDLGGKGFNVSRALLALGTPSVAVGLVGGPAGRRIAEGLSALGLATELVTLAAGETRTNVTVVAPDRHVKVNEPGPTVGPEEEAQLVARVRALARAGDLWVLSGSLPPGARPELYAELVRIVQGAGARALLDTSGPALRAGCAAAPFLVKPNAVEARELTGIALAPLALGGAAQPAAESDGELRAVLDAIHRLGPAHVLLTLGADGAVLSDGARTWRATPPAVEERNPIGAGDALLAGFTFGLARGLRLAEALRWALAAGAAAASLPGTAVGDRELVERLAAGVVISETPS